MSKWLYVVFSLSLGTIACVETGTPAEINSTESEVTEAACVCTARVCSSNSDCGAGSMCKFLGACGFRCQGGFLDLCVSV